MDFYHYRVVVYINCQDTFPFKQCVKVIFATDDPFNETQLCSISMCSEQLISGRAVSRVMLTPNRDRSHSIVYVFAKH